MGHSLSVVVVDFGCWTDSDMGWWVFYSSTHCWKDLDHNGLGQSGDEWSCWAALMASIGFVGWMLVLGICSVLPDSIVDLQEG